MAKLEGSITKATLERLREITSGQWELGDARTKGKLKQLLRKKANEKAYSYS